MDIDPPTRGLPFILQRVCLVILIEQLFGEDITVIFPGIVSLGVSFPFDQILQSSLFLKPSMVPDGLDLILLFSIDDVWGWSREVGSVLPCLLIWGEKPGMKDVVHCPGWGKVQLIRHWGDDSNDFERSVSFWGKFQVLIGEFQILAL